MQSSTPEAYFGPAGPPSSALPKTLSDLRTMSKITQMIAVMAYNNTLNPSAPASTLNSPPCKAKKIFSKK